MPIPSRSTSELDLSRLCDDVLPRGGLTGVGERMAADELVFT